VTFLQVKEPLASPFWKDPRAQGFKASLGSIAGPCLKKQKREPGRAVEVCVHVQMDLEERI
jgi:hypothetical protein